MRMHAVALGSIVLEEDLDGVLDLGVQGGAQKSKMLPLGRALLERGEGAVSVFVIDGLAIDPADLVLIGFDIHLCILVERHIHHVVHAHGGVVPINFIDSHVVGAGFALGFCS